MRGPRPHVSRYTDLTMLVEESFLFFACGERRFSFSVSICRTWAALLPVVSQSIGERPFPFIAFRRLRNTFERLCHTIAGIKKLFEST